MRRARISAMVVLRFLQHARPTACFGVVSPAVLRRARRSRQRGAARTEPAGQAGSGGRSSHGSGSSSGSGNSSSGGNSSCSSNSSSSSPWTSHCRSTSATVKRSGQPGAARTNQQQQQQQQRKQRKQQQQQQHSCSSSSTDGKRGSRGSRTAVAAAQRSDSGQGGRDFVSRFTVKPTARALNTFVCSTGQVKVQVIYDLMTLRDFTHIFTLKCASYKAKCTPNASQEATQEAIRNSFTHIFDEARGMQG